MLKILSLLFIGSLGFSLSTNLTDSTDPTDPEKEKVIQSTVIGILEQYHYEPEDLDDDFSNEVFDLFLSYIDSRKRFLTKEDLDMLEQFRYELDDQIQSGSFEFFNKATELLSERVKNVDEIYQEILAEPFDFDVDESFEFDPDNKMWSADDTTLKDTWRKQLKYDVLTDLSSLINKQKTAQKRLEKDEYPEEEDSETNLKSEDRELCDKSIADLEIQAREQVLDDYDKWYESYEKVRRSDRFESYLNTITHIFDPHSDYFNPKEKQDFDINMGGKLEGIGARLRTEGDLTQVVSIVPGGPVWKNKQIEVNDYILKIRQHDEEEALDVSGWRIDDVVSKIRGKKGTRVILTIEKKDGSVIDVELERDVINILDSAAKSAIIELDDVMDKIGYIDLPKFYSSFDGPEGNSCAKDVAQEITKLKENNVNGIILDLRGNGGGSLKDVVDMSGLFIEEGPIVQVKPRDRRPYVYNDEEDGVHYDGPLIVLVNSFSASASEILAAAMQDYDRAIIVGSQSFGKGTVQRFVDLDRAVKGNQEFKPLGQIKLTMQKFYRVNGGSTQLRGVTPDIILPDRFRKIDVGEREYPHAMEWSQLPALEFEQEVYKIPSRSLLKQKSEARLSDDETFALINEHGEWFEESRNKTSYSLNLTEHQAWEAKKKQMSERFKMVTEGNIEGLSVIDLPQDAEAINKDEDAQANHQDWVEALLKDVYLEEVLSIMKDMVDNSEYTAIEKTKP